MNIGDLIPIGGSGTATADKVLAGETFSNSAGIDIMGTMPNRGNVGIANITSQNGEYVIPAGFHNGLGKAKAIFSNLLAENIKTGVNIGGIIGNLIQGKKWASGTITTNASSNIVVSGLSFIPTRIIAIRDTKEWCIAVDTVNLNSTNTFYRYNNSGGLGTIHYINQEGFSIAGISASMMYNWFAIE